MDISDSCSDYASADSNLRDHHGKKRDLADMYMQPAGTRWQRI